MKNNVSEAICSTIFILFFMWITSYFSNADNLQLLLKGLHKTELKISCSIAAITNFSHRGALVAKCKRYLD